MCHTGAAIGNPPFKTRKPGEFFCWRTSIAAAGNSSKTSDLVDNAAGIGKRVLVRSLDFYALNRACNDLAALAAQNLFRPFRLFIFYLLAL